MSGPVKDRGAMLRNMAPQRQAGSFAFSTVPVGAPLPKGCLASFMEHEGLSVLCPALENDPLAMAWITLTVHSALDGVGLTAAVSSALAEADIPCNIIAAHHHDHVFVPVHRADTALEILNALAASHA